ncbi:MAG: ABC transporter permease [Acidobacteriota bacterium]|nr:MAG: ABC transporter permease [Acidobacteriota bacterium]
MTFGFYLRWAIQNLRNHSIRNLLTAVGIGVAVAILICILGFYRGYRSSLQESIQMMGFHVLVTAKGCPYEAATLILRGGQIPMYIDEQIYQKVAAHPNVEFITRLFLQTVPSDDGTRFNFFMGVEDTFLKMKPWLSFQRGGWFSSPEADEVILGFNAASLLEKDLDDTFELGRFPRPLRVVGILDRSGSQDDGTIFLPLGLAQKLFDKRNKLTGLGIRVKDLGELDRFVEDIYDLPSVQVIATAQIQGTLLRLVESTRSVMLSIGICAALIAAVALINTVLMSVFERTREFGVIRAVGGETRHLFLIVCLETALVTLVGSLLGSILALSLQQGAERLVQAMLPFSPAGSVLQFSPIDLGAILLVSVTVGVCCGLYPAFRASRMRPVVSMRYGE